MRSLSQSILRKIYEEHINAHAAAILSGTTDFLGQYDLASNLMLHLIEDPELVDCTEEKIPNYLKYCKSIRSIISQSPVLFMFGEEMKTMCSFKWESNSSDNFKFYYSYQPTADEFFYLKEFNGSTNFSNFSLINDGLIIDNSYENTMRILYPKDPPQATWNVIFYEIVNNEIQYTLSGNRYRHSTFQNTYYMNSVGININVLLEEIESIAKLVPSSYVLLTENGNVLIDSFTGRTLPIGFNEEIPIFPNLTQLNNSFWNNVSENRDEMKNGAILKMKFYDEIYFVKEVVIIIGQIPVFHFIVAINFSTPRGELYFKSALIFAICFISLGGSYFIIKFINKNLKKRFDKKKKKIHTEIDRNLYYDPNIGSLGRSVYSIRTLQLKYSDEAMLNKILDSAVSSLANSRETIFGEVIKRSDLFINCRRQPPLPNEDPLPYSHWRATTGRGYSMARREFEFRWGSAAANPSYYLVRTVGSAIVSMNLFFSDIDVDSFLFFVQDFVKNHSPSPIMAVYRATRMIYLLQGPFKGILPNRIDELLMIISAICSRTKLEVDPDPALAMTCAVKDISAGFVLDLLRKYINQDQDGYIDSCLRSILIMMDSHFTLDLLGELALVSNSPDFSIRKNMADQHIFIRSVAKLVDYSAYWGPSECLSEALFEETLTSQVRDAERCETLQYHYTIAKKAVKPLLLTINNFIPLELPSNSLRNNIVNLKFSIENLI